MPAQRHLVPFTLHLCIPSKPATCGNTIVRVTMATQGQLLHTSDVAQHCTQHHQHSSTHTDRAGCRALLMFTQKNSSKYSASCSHHYTALVELEHSMHAMHVAACPVAGHGMHTAVAGHGMHTAAAAGCLAMSPASPWC